MERNKPLLSFLKNILQWEMETLKHANYSLKKTVYLERKKKKEREQQTHFSKIFIVIDILALFF